MNTTLLLLAMFERPLLTAEQVGELFHLSPKTVRNRAAAGTFPRPLPDGLWHLNDLAQWIDHQREEAKQAVASGVSPLPGKKRSSTPPG